MTFCIQHGTHKYVPGTGNPQAKLLICGEAPGADEEQKGEPFVGQSGKMLRDMVEKAGISWSETYRTNILKYRPPNNDLKRLHEIDHTFNEGMDQLWQEINAINPNGILPVGQTALRYLTGKDKIDKWRGSILESVRGYPKCIPTIHPARLLHSMGGDGNRQGALPYHVRLFIQHDILRAVKESAYPEMRLPDRILEIANSSLTLYRYLQNYKDATEYASDIEVIKSICICIGIAFDPNHAISVPLIDLPGFNNIPSIHERAEMIQMLDDLFRDKTKKCIGQNWKFDQDKIIKNLGIAAPDPYIDTELLSHTIYPEFPKGLAFQTSIYTREPYYKDEYKEFNWKKDDIKKIFLYNAKDCAVTLEIKQKTIKEAEELGVKDFYFNFISPMHGLFHEVENVGFKVDLEERARLTHKYLVWLEEEKAKLNTIAGYTINVASNPAVWKLLYKDLQLPERAGAGEDILVALLGNNIKNEVQRAAIESIIAQRRIKRALDLVTAPLDFDGRMRTNIRIDGTETGRRSTKNLEPPIRPYRHDSLGRLRPIGIPSQTITKHGNYGADIRKMYIADEGMVFGEADSSQAEDRIVTLLGKDFAGLDSYDKIDRHRLTASWFLGIAENLLDTISPDKRFMGKKGRHSANYDAQKYRLMMDINNGARKFDIRDKVTGKLLTVSERQANDMLNIIHARSPHIRGVFHKEVREISEANKEVLVNPFGRRRQFFGRPGPETDREKYANIPQSTVGDNTVRAMVAVKKREPTLQIILESHDAFLFQTRPEDFERVAAVVTEEMEREIDFSKCSLPRPPLRLPCEIKIGTNYLEMKKWNPNQPVI
jgi:uracil-DNA glycosylase family 4